MNNEVKSYKPSGKNDFRDERYSHMSNLNKLNKSLKYGKTKNGSRYYHVIEFDESNPYNLLGEEVILRQVNERFKSKAGDKKRVLTNMLASQACCFNLFAPLKLDVNKNLANSLFSNLLQKKVTVSRIEIEFTPSKEESIGDQSTNGGTDSDLAVFYEIETGGKGVILLEIKYIEEKFSVCSSYRTKNGSFKDGNAKPNIRPICDNPNFINEHNSQNIATPSCGYMRYENWGLTMNSSVFNYEAIKKAPFCPFRFSLNQLWRNMLLAEKVSHQNNLEEFHFWVLSPKQNIKLWNNYSEDVAKEFSQILTNKGKKSFRKLDLEEDFVTYIELNSKSEWNMNWMKKFREKYID